MERKTSSHFISKSLIFEQESSFLESVFHHTSIPHSKKKEPRHTKTSKQYIPSSLHINDAIDHAIIDSKWKYISFTRYEDEPIIDYLNYAGVIRSTMNPIDYSEKFEIDQVIGRQFIGTYRTWSKKIELIIAEYPMIWAWCIGTWAAVASGTLLWFIHRLLDLWLW